MQMPLLCHLGRVPVQAPCQSNSSSSTFNKPPAPPKMLFRFSEAMLSYKRSDKSAVDTLPMFTAITWGGTVIMQWFWCSLQWDLKQLIFKEFYFTSDTVFHLWWILFTNKTKFINIVLPCLPFGSQDQL